MIIRIAFWLGVLAIATLAGCASRPINEPINQVDRRMGYRLETRAAYASEGDTLIILAFSEGGTRAAAGKVVRESADFQALKRAMSIPAASPPPPPAINVR